MKKVLKIILIIFVSLIALLIILFIYNYINSKKSYISDNYYDEFTTNNELEKKYSKLGDFEVSQIDYKVDDKNIDKIRIWYPRELEKSDLKYPMIIVVNASNTKSLNFEPFFKHLASWGFIVVGNENLQTGNGESSEYTLNYMLNIKKDSIFYDKIDLENIGIVGHSQGGAGAIRAATEFENSKYYKTIFTASAAYSLLSKNMGWEYDTSKIKISYFMTAGTGNSDDNGVEDIEKEFGGVAPLKSVIENYDKISDDITKIRARFKGAEHGDMLVKTDPYMTAWFIWQLQDDNEAAKVFVGEDAEILNNSNWQDIEKNF